MAWWFLKLVGFNKHSRIELVKMVTLNGSPPQAGLEHRHDMVQQPAKVAFLLAKPWAAHPSATSITPLSHAVE